MRTGIVICNYNMPESTDNLAQHIKNTVKSPYDLVVVDNGSTERTSDHTTLYLPENVQMTRGFMEGVRSLDETGRTYDFYWLIITSVEFDPEDKRDPVKLLTSNFDENTFAVQPSLTKTGMETTAWEVLKPRNTLFRRRVWATDYCCTMYRAAWFNELGRWNENLRRGWGVGDELFYLARKKGWKIYTQDGYVMRHKIAIGYDLDRMGETYKKRAEKAKEEMDAEFIPKYGERYLDVLNWSYREFEY